MKKKILKIVLGFVFSFSLTFAAFAIEQQKQQKIVKLAEKDEKETVMVKYEYLNKDMNKKSVKTDDLGSVFENKTSEKEFLNAYVLLKRLFKKISMDGIFFKNCTAEGMTVFSFRKDLKLSGELFLDLNSKQKQDLKNVLNTTEVEKIEIEKEEFSNAKEELISLLENKIKEFENYSEKEKKEKLGQNQTEKTKKDLLEVFKNRIEKIKNIKFEDVLNLTKELKVEKNLKEFGKLMP